MAQGLGKISQFKDFKVSSHNASLLESVVGQQKDGFVS
jgi:hypothetical protein